ncbi:MAG: ArsR/SmtB family transcription factor [Phycisphaerae bacterium]
MDSALATLEQKAEQLSRIFRLMGDPTRLRLILTLHKGPATVTELCKKLKLPQPNVSRHLGLLRMGELVNADRQGKQVVYSLSEPAPTTVRAMQALGKKYNPMQVGPLEIKLPE